MLMPKVDLVVRVREDYLKGGEYVIADVTSALTSAGETRLASSLSAEWSKMTNRDFFSAARLADQYVTVLI